MRHLDISCGRSGGRGLSPRGAVVAGLLVAGAAAVVGAQTPALAGPAAAAALPATAACRYDTCALRREGQQVVRGAAGTPVARLGVWRAPDLLPLLGPAPSDSAAAYARTFHAHYARGQRAAMLGAMAGGALTGVAASSPLSQDERLRLMWGVVGSTVVYVWGAGHLRRAEAALARALWWHNRDLPR